MHRLDVGDGGPVETIFVVRVDLKVWQSCFIAGSGHQVAAVAHEVVLVFVEGGVVGVTTRYAGGCI